MFNQESQDLPAGPLFAMHSVTLRGICLAVLVCGTSGRLGNEPEDEDEIRSMWAFDEETDTVQKRKRNWRLSCAEFSVMQSLADENAQYSAPEQALRAAFVKTCKFKDTETGAVCCVGIHQARGRGRQRRMCV